jgi:branched-chain amino acid transport system substrate-binding protein
VRSSQTSRRFSLRVAPRMLAISAIAALSIATVLSGTAGAASGGGLGTANPAKGTPVTVGIITDGGSGDVGSAGEIEQGAKMATSYLNSYSGGLAGHKINLYICENQNTPAGGQTCANDMVQKGVVAVVLPFTGQGETEVPTITKAGIPYITLSGASEAELTTPGAFAITGGFPADLGAIALQAKAKGYKKVAFLVSNVPAAIQGAQVFGALVFKATHVGFQVIPVGTGSADMTPELQSAVSGGASAIGMVGDVTFCSSFLQGYKTLALTLPKYVLTTCFDPSILKSPTLSQVLKGSYVATSTQASPKEKALYAAIAKKYAPKVSPNLSTSANQASGLQPVFTLASIMKGVTGPVTAATVLHQTETAKNVPLPFTGGITFTCNGTAIPLIKSVCSASAAIGTAGNGTNVTHIKAYNPTPLFG